MNVFLLPPSIRISLLVLIALAGVRSGTFAQSKSPYRALLTARDQVVNDTVSGQNLSIYAVSPQPQHGDVDITMLQSGGSGNPYIYAISYTPDAGFTGVDTFTVELNYQGSYPYLIYRGYRVSVLPGMLTARADFAVTTAGTPVTVDVLANDSSPNGPLTITALPQVKNGTASLVGNNSIEFTPATGYTGVGYVQYAVCDTVGACKTAQVAIGVNPSNNPSSDTVQVATAKNTALTMPLTHTGYTVFQAPANGTVFMANGHSYRYIPSSGFAGTDQFILATDDYGPTVFRTVKVKVLNTPGQNTMALADRVFTPKGTPVTFNVRENDIGNLLVKSWVTPANLPGNISNTNGIGNVTFTPDTGFTGVATFYYKIGNMFVPDLEIAPVEVVVGNLPPALATYTLTTPQETPMVINYQIPFTGFDFVITDAPDDGDLTYYPGFSTHTLNGQTISGYNLLIYTPDNNFVGTDQFEIDYCVQANGQCRETKVSVDVVQVFNAPPPYCVDDCVWTGDVNSDGVVNNKDILPLGYYMGLGGPNRANASLEWYGQHAGDWANPYLSHLADLKHADTDGSGQVDTDDTLAVSFFYGLTHQLTPQIPPASKGLPFYLNILTPNPGVGDLVEVEVSLGNASHPVTDLYGFTFDVSLSPQIVDSALQMHYYDGSWLNSNAADLWMYKTPAQGRLESAFTRTNGVSASGYGIVGEMSFIIIDIIDGGKLNSPQPFFTIEVDPSSVMWADGTTSVGEPITFQVPLRVQKRELPSNEDLRIYPSPAQDLLQVHLNGDDLIEDFWIYDATGKTVYASGPVRWEHAELNVSHLPNGFYV
ncbi:MAG: T9SS type A sorting domain-containing protein, partial [Bacteroidetes bacterium]